MEGSVPFAGRKAASLLGGLAEGDSTEVANGVNVWVDGGIGEDQIEGVERLGVKFIVMGRVVFEDRDRIIKVDREI